MPSATWCCASSLIGSAVRSMIASSSCRGGEEFLIVGVGLDDAEAFAAAERGTSRRERTPIRYGNRPSHPGDGERGLRDGPAGGVRDRSRGSRRRALRGQARGRNRVSVAARLDSYLMPSSPLLDAMMDADALTSSAICNRCSDRSRSWSWTHDRRDAQTRRGRRVDDHVAAVVCRVGDATAFAVACGQPPVVHVDRPQRGRQ